MFPFEIAAKEVGGVKQVLSFLGVGVDDKDNKYVAVERVWCSEDGTTCNNNAMFEAYKPYLIQLKAGATNITFNNQSQIVLKATPSDDLDVMQNADYNQYGNYVFRGVLQRKTWGANDDDILGTDKSASYGFAKSATGITPGQFVKVAEGAYIKPLRAFIYKSPVSQNARANDSFAKRHGASIDDDLPEVMRIFIVDSQENDGEQTTAIGQFNSRTGEIRLDHTNHTYDLNGRAVRDEDRKAKGVYITNGVKRVIK